MVENERECEKRKKKKKKGGGGGRYLGQAH